jgi:hypothetical protein
MKKKEDSERIKDNILRMMNEERKSDLYKLSERKEQSIKFDIDEFKSQCLKMYESLMEKNIERVKESNSEILTECLENITKTNDEICSKVHNEINEKIRRVFDGDELHKYKPIEGALAFLKKLYGKYKHKEDKPEIINKFTSDSDEYIIMCKKIYTRNLIHHVFLTNQSNYIVLIINIYNLDEDTEIPKEIGTVFHGNFNFSLPYDYYKIINKILDINATNHEEGVRRSSSGNDLELRTISPRILLENILPLMKETLYDRKFIPLYAKEILEEDKKIKEEFEMFKEDKRKFNEYKQEYEIKIAPYKELFTAETKLQEDKEKLKLISKKISIDKEEFEKQKEGFEKMKISETELIKKQKEEFEKMKTDETELIKKQKEEFKLEREKFEVEKNKLKEIDLTKL